MPETIGTAFISIRPDTTGFAKQAEGKVAADGKKMGSRFGAMFAVGAGVVVGAFLKSSFGEAQEAQKIAKPDRGGHQVHGWCGAGLSPAGREACRAALEDGRASTTRSSRPAQNMLLTFKNIRNETGQG